MLLDTFVVRTLLVPALADDIGRAIWWPSKLARRDVDEAAEASNDAPKSTARATDSGAR